MKKTMMILGFALGLAFAAGAWQPPETKRDCRTYADSILHVAFPSELGGLRLATRSTYKAGDEDYSLRYNPANTSVLDTRHLDLYVYRRDGMSLTDGVNETVKEELRQQSATIRRMGDDGQYEKVRMLNMYVAGRLTGCGLDYLWFSNTMKFPDTPRSHQSFTLAFFWRGRVIKLRYSEPIVSGDVQPSETLPNSFQCILAGVDRLICDAEAAMKVDIYKITDPQAALAALRRRWVGVDDRVPAADMPDFSEQIQRFYDFASWCQEKRAERGAQLEYALALGVGLKVNPPEWYYNFACALAGNGKTDEAISVLEQALVAGYNDADYARKDPDLASLRQDARFKRLLELCALIPGNLNAAPARAVVKNRALRLDNSNVFWNFADHSYRVEVEGATDDTLIYLDHNVEHAYPPAEGMTQVKYAEDLVDKKRDIAGPNVHFVDARTGRRFLPTLMLCEMGYDCDHTNRHESLIARQWPSDLAARVEEEHLYRNVLGVYPTGADYGGARGAGVDRILTWSPATLACYEKPEDLLSLCAEAWHEMKPEIRAKGGVRQLLGLIRRGQKCVQTEADFQSGPAQRPSLDLAAIDADKVRTLARQLAKPYPEIPELSGFGVTSCMTRPVEVRAEIFERIYYGRGRHHAGLVVRGAEQTLTFEAHIPRGPGQVVCKLLQGDAQKFHLTRKAAIPDKGTTNDVFEVSCDYQPAFDVTLADGRKLKTTRVDVGFFRVVDGVSSLPAVVTLCYLPNETREYGADGILKRIDYTKQQVPGWQPWFSPRGDMVDTFHWTPQRELLGWTRTYADGTTDAFTQDGLIVQTRDAQGRPLDVRRSLRMDGLQGVWPFVPGTDDFDEKLNANRSQHELVEDDPAKSTLAWKYAYTNATERFGEVQPKPTRPWSYRPELCLRAEFAPTSGFTFPLINQMNMGYSHYVDYAYDRRSAQTAWEDAREDSSARLHEKGLVAPKTLKKMKFCSWHASTNDLWQLDGADFDRVYGLSLVELAEGVYLFRKAAEEEGEKDEYASIRKTFRAYNLLGEHAALQKLNESYPLCDRATIERVIGAKLNWDEFLLGGRRALSSEDLPEGVTHVIAMWKIAPDRYLSMLTTLRTEMRYRHYAFIKVDPKSGKMQKEHFFFGFPSRAIGNTVLRAFEDDPAALNNLAVLKYAEIANPMEYKEADVIQLLRRALEKGNAQAAENLGVLFENRGEKDKAKSFYEQARKMIKCMHVCF